MNSKQHEEQKLEHQLWLDDWHGKVTSGLYGGNLLRAGMCHGPYIDMLMPESGWMRLDSIFEINESSMEKLVALKRRVDMWLAA